MKKHPRLYLGLLAGVVAITANTLVLKAAPLMAVNAESGGLLKLGLLHTTPVLPAGLLPVVKAEGFKLLFHYLTGLGMVGGHVLTAGGMAYFFVANAVFGLVLGGLYAYLRQQQEAAGV